MGTSYPTAVDSFTNPTSGDTLASVPHAGQHSDANDAVAAIEAKLGTGASLPNVTGQVLTAQGGGASAYAAPTPRTAVVVAAVGASADQRQKADYVCDGTADDVEIQAAINTDPDILVLVGPTFAISATLSWTTNKRMLVLAFGVTFQLAASVAGVRISQGNSAAKGVTVWGLTVDGQSNTATVGFDLEDTNNSVLRECEATGCTTGFQLYSNAASAFVEGSRLDQCVARTCTTGLLFSRNAGSGSFAQTEITAFKATGCTTGISAPNGAILQRSVIRATVWIGSSQTALSLDCNIEDTEFYIGIEGASGATGNVGVLLGTNTTNSDQAWFFLKYTGTIATQATWNNKNVWYWAGGSQMAQSTGTSVLGWKRHGDAANRFQLELLTAGPRLSGGTGGAAVDVNLYRSAANVWASDDKIDAASLNAQTKSGQPADGDVVGGAADGDFILDIALGKPVWWARSGGAWATTRTQAATYVVAAAGSSTMWKKNADYVCDGTADDVEINAAITALGASTGMGTILLAPGEYNIASSILIIDHATQLLGCGTGQDNTATHNSIGTRLKAATGLTGAVILVQASGNTAPLHGIRIADLTVDGNSIGTGVDGIHFRAYRSLLDNVHVYSCTGNGINVEGYSTWTTYDTYIRNCTVGACASGAGFLFNTYAQDDHLVDCIAFDNQDGLSINAASQQILGCHFYGNTRYGVVFNGSGSRTKITNCKIEGSGQHGLFFDSSTSGASDIIVAACNFKNNGSATNNTYDHLNITGSGSNGVSRFSITACAFTYASGNGNYPSYGVNFSGSTVQNALLEGCAFGPSSHFGTGPVNDSSNSSSPAYIRNNVGYVTEASGTATVANGTTSIAVTHGLGTTPALADIQVTPTDNMGSATKYWISSPGATTFTINVDVNPGADAVFAWLIDRLHR